MSVVSVEEVKRVAHLARMKLTEEELARFAGQLDEILRYVQQLKSASTEKIEPTSHVLALSNIMRTDQLLPSVNPEEVLKTAPARHGQFFKVPKILEV